MINYYFVIYLGHRNIALSFPYRPFFFLTHINIQFEIRILWLCKYICLYFNVLNDNSEYLKGRGLLVVTYKMHYVGTTFTLR